MQTLRPKLIISQVVAEAKQAIDRANTGNKVLSAKDIGALPNALQNVVDDFRSSGQQSINTQELLSAFESTLEKGLSLSLAQDELVGAELSKDLVELLSFSQTGVMVSQMLVAKSEPKTFDEALKAAQVAQTQTSGDVHSQLGAFEALKVVAEAAKSDAPTQAKHFSSLVRERGRDIRKNADAAVAQSEQAVTSPSDEGALADLLATLDDALLIHRAVNPRSTRVKALSKQIQTLQGQKVSLKGQSALSQNALKKGPPIIEEPEEPVVSAPIDAEQMKVVVEKMSKRVFQAMSQSYTGVTQALEASRAVANDEGASAQVKTQNQIMVRAFDYLLKGHEGIKKAIADTSDEMTLEIFSPPRDARLAGELQLYKGLGDRFQKVADFTAAYGRRRDFSPEKAITLSVLNLFLKGHEAMSARIAEISSNESPSAFDAIEKDGLELMGQGSQKLESALEELEDLMQRARMTPEAHQSATMQRDMYKQLLTQMQRFDD